MLYFLVVIFSSVVLAKPTVKILVNDRLFNSERDKLKAGAKIKVECVASDKAAYAKVILNADYKYPATGFLLEKATLEYTVLEGDGYTTGYILVDCIVSRNGNFIDEGESVRLQTEMQKVTNQNPEKLNAMNLLVDAKPYAFNSGKLKIGAKVKLECISSDNKSYARAVINANDKYTSAEFTKEKVAIEYTVVAEDGKVSGHIGTYCYASRDGKKIDDSNSKLLPTEQEMLVNKNPARVNTLTVNVTQPTGGAVKPILDVDAKK